MATLRQSIMGKPFLDMKDIGDIDLKDVPKIAKQIGIFYYP